MRGSCKSQFFTYLKNFFFTYWLFSVLQTQPLNGQHSNFRSMLYFIERNRSPARVLVGRFCMQHGTNQHVLRTNQIYHCCLIERNASSSF